MLLLKHGCKFFDNHLITRWGSFPLYMGRTVWDFFKAKSKSHISPALLYGTLALRVQRHDVRSTSILRPPYFEEAQPRGDDSGRNSGQQTHLSLSFESPWPRCQTASKRASGWFQFLQWLFESSFSRIFKLWPQTLRSWDIPSPQYMSNLLTHRISEYSKSVVVLWH